MFLYVQEKVCMSHMSQDCLCTRMHTRKRCGGEAAEHVRGVCVHPSQRVNPHKSQSP